MIIKSNLKRSVHSSQTVYVIMKEILNARQIEEQHKEYFYTVGLDSKNRIKVIDLNAIGTINRCLPSMREIFRTALYNDCASIILVHNHPSGDCTASSEDIRFTEEAKKAAEILEIRLLDHIIVGDNKYYSFADNREVI